MSRWSKRNETNHVVIGLAQSKRIMDPKGILRMPQKGSRGHRKKKNGQRTGLGGESQRIKGRDRERKNWVKKEELESEKPKDQGRQKEKRRKKRGSKKTKGDLKKNTGCRKREKKTKEGGFEEDQGTNWRDVERDQGVCVEKKRRGGSKRPRGTEGMPKKWKIEVK